MNSRVSTVIILTCELRSLQSKRSNIAAADNTYKRPQIRMCENVAIVSDCKGVAMDAKLGDKTRTGNTFNEDKNNLHMIINLNSSSSLLYFLEKASW